MTQISAVTGRSPSRQATTGTMSEYDKQIQSLMKQRSQIEEEMANVKANQDMDTKVKAERIKSLTSQMQTIDAQIAQIRADQMENRKNGSSKNAESRETKTDNASGSAMDQLIRADAMHGQLSKTNSVRSKMEAAANTLKSEVRLGRLQFELGEAKDSGRAEMLQNAEMTVFKKKTEQETALKSKIAGLDGKIGDTLATVQKNTQQSEGTDTEEDDAQSKSISANSNQSLSESTAAAQKQGATTTSSRQAVGVYQSRIDVRI